MGKKKNGKGKVRMKMTDETRSKFKEEYWKYQTEIYILGMRVDPAKIKLDNAHVENCKGKRRLNLLQIMEGQYVCAWLHTNLDNDGKCDTYNSSLYNNNFWRVGLTVKDTKDQIDQLGKILNPKDETFEASSDDTSASTSFSTSASTSVSTSASTYVPPFNKPPPMRILIREYIKFRVILQHSYKKDDIFYDDETYEKLYPPSDPKNPYAINEGVKSSSENKEKQLREEPVIKTHEDEDLDKLPTPSTRLHTTSATASKNNIKSSK